MTHIDFIVPVYNGMSTIEACLESVLACPVPHRVFVVDNGSTDGTPDAVARVAARAGERFWWTSVRDRSKARAANLAFRQGIAPVVWCVDADVVFDRNRFRECLSALDAFECLLLTPDERDARPRPVSFDWEFSAARDTFLIRRATAGASLFSPWYPRCGAEDLDLMLRLLKDGRLVGRTWGGFRHLRVGRSMGWRRRAHFVLWNTITHLRHFNCAYSRARLCRQALTFPVRVWQGLREELDPGPRRS